MDFDSSHGYSSPLGRIPSGGEWADAQPLHTIHVAQFHLDSVIERAQNPSDYSALASPAEADSAPGQFFPNKLGPTIRFRLRMHAAGLNKRLCPIPD